jgi:hypothetical protein
MILPSSEVGRPFSSSLQYVVNVGLDARVEILRGLGRIPPQLPTVVTPRTTICSHPHQVEDELVRLRAQIGFGQLRNLRRCDLPTRVKCFGYCFDRIELRVLSALKEVESLTTGSWLLSGHDGIEEDAVELANLGYRKLHQSTPNFV